MNYSIKRNERNEVTLTLGKHSVTFNKPPRDIEDVIQGVEVLIMASLGVSAFQLVTAVLKEFNLVEEDPRAEPVGKSEVSSEIQQPAGTEEKTCSTECSTGNHGEERASAEG